jgi:hypothetical protein
LDDFQQISAIGAPPLWCCSGLETVALENRA